MLVPYPANKSRKLLPLRTLVLTVLVIAQPLVCPAQDPPAGGETVPHPFRVDSESSWLRVLVYRGGLLRGFAHNHVISNNDLTGTITIAQDPLQSTIMLEFRVADLVVDEPALRALEGADFPGQISHKDIAGTRANMLGGKLLQFEQFPSIQIVSEEITGNLPDLVVAATVVIRGVRFPVVFPAAVALSGDSFVASGELEIGHRELGLSPFKAAFGTLRVRDKLVIKYEISGSRTFRTD